MEYFNLGLAFLLVLANGFFVATEFAIVKIRPTQLKALVDEGRPGAAGALGMVEKLDAYLSATQFGITLSSLGLGWIGEAAFVKLVQPPVQRLIPNLAAAEAISHTIAVTVAFSVITVLHIVVGELAPKSLAIQKPEAVTLSVAAPMRLFHFIFYPGIWALNGMARNLLKLLGLDSAHESHEVHSEEELRIILSGAAASGAIGQTRADLLERALSMLEKTVRQVLVPRNQVRFLDLDEPLDKNVSEARAVGHTWLPVVRNNLDQVEGVINVKDLFFLLSRGQLKTLAQVQRPVLFVPESVTLEQLLTEFRRRRRQFAIVVDEHGGTSGIVSLADVVSEVVGDVAEMGRKVDEVRTLPGGRLELPGSTSLDDLQERLDVVFDVPLDEVTTIGGFLMTKLGRIPKTGDKVPLGEFEVVVDVIDGPRVVRVRIHPRVEAPAK